MGGVLGIVAAKDPDFMIKSLLKLNVLGQEVYLTTTHVSLLIICTFLIVFAVIVRSKLKDTDGKPGALQNVAELIVEMLDGMVSSSMGKKGNPYRNYMGTLFIFLLISNLSGLLGLRPPTADYGVTLGLGLITFFIVQTNNIRYNKLGAFTDLFKPLPFLFPINFIGEIATPISLSLRLFGNVLAGTVIMALIYGLLSSIAFLWPGVLHVYFDIFSGAIQAYVFCMLTMVFVGNKIPDKE
ncbi:MAG: F0F1 ATP synthase subunit A [Tyzzerella sp.]|nr:F0F1 ATP synthase subunit A [Tyzzerella sp.]